MNIRYFEEDQILFINDKEIYGDSKGEFEILESDIRHTKFCDFPRNISFILCDHVIGDRNDLYSRSPDATFHIDINGKVSATVNTVFIPDQELNVEMRRDFIASAILQAQNALIKLYAIASQLGEPSVYDDIGYLSFSLRLSQETIRDAEDFVTEIESKILANSSEEADLLFVCHAKEDKIFVDRLVNALDNRALHSWYSSRELFVGDSIVDGISKALSKVRYVVAVLSPQSVVKPWVRRELSSTLMRQLSQEQIKILPVMIETCDLPVLIADIKYADFRTSFDAGLQELLDAIR
jgi:hypothetical protein